MKKLGLIIIMMFIGVNVVNAERIEVDFKKCVDGDTAYFTINGEDKKFRFLAVDTPETVHPTKGEEEGGKTASEFTCNSLKNAKKIEVEYDSESDKIDKYNRELVWVYIDGVMLQETMIKKGYAEVAYIYGKYKYVDNLCKVQEGAVKNKYGIWYDGTREVGYCNKNLKKTTKKTTTKSSDIEKVIKYVNDEKYFSALEELLKEYPLSYAIIIIIVIVGIIALKKKL